MFDPVRRIKYWSIKATPLCIINCINLLRPRCKLFTLITYPYLFFTIRIVTSYDTMYLSCIKSLFLYQLLPLSSSSFSIKWVIDLSHSTTFFIIMQARRYTSVTSISILKYTNVVVLASTDHQLVVTF